ncbi:hypothetical protein D3C81_1361220 [compost metagenome]
MNWAKFVVVPSAAALLAASACNGREMLSAITAATLPPIIALTVLLFILPSPCSSCWIYCDAKSVGGKYYKVVICSSVIVA